MHINIEKIRIDKQTYVHRDRKHIDRYSYIKTDIPTYQGLNRVQLKSKKLKRATRRDREQAKDRNSST